ncbi:MAG: hypothetical protein IPJ07_21900 [Acidobacteria bacterium]|nr:hypothetical protein [Acidobacteriota bacterium]
MNATTGAVSINGDVWADNWFALYLGDKLLIEDSVSITTERSFNAESFTFNADYPIVLNFVLKDFKQDDSGLEYIGTKKQQLGDGGFIAQFTDVENRQVTGCNRCKMALHGTASWSGRRSVRFCRIACCWSRSLRVHYDQGTVELEI